MRAQRGAGAGEFLVAKALCEFLDAKGEKTKAVLPVLTRLEDHVPPVGPNGSLTAVWLRVGFSRSAEGSGAATVPTDPASAARVIGRYWGCGDGSAPHRSRVGGAEFAVQ